MIDVSQSFSVILDFDDGNLDLWDGLSEVGSISGRLSMQLAERQVSTLPGPIRALQAGTVTIQDVDGNQATATGDAISDLFFKQQDFGAAGRKDRNFVIDFRGQGLTNVPAWIRFDLQANDGAGTNVIDPTLVKIFNLEISDDDNVKVEDEEDVPDNETERVKARFTDLDSRAAKATAGVSPVTVQRSIDTHVNNLIEFTHEWNIPTIVDVGGMDDIRPAKEHSVTADAPGVREGNDLRVVRYSARSTRPDVPIQITYRGKP